MVAVAARAELYAHDRTYMWKLILRLICFVFDFIAIVLTGHALNNVPRPSLSYLLADFKDEIYTDNNPYNMDENKFLVGWQFIPLGLSFFWCFTNLVVPLFFRRGKQVSAGANVGCDLLLWTGLVVTSFFAFMGGFSLLDGYWSNYGYKSFGYGHGTYNNGTNFEVLPNGTQVTGAKPCYPFADCVARNNYVDTYNTDGFLILAGSGFTCMLTLMHFALFVSACRYTHQQRKNKGDKRRKSIEAEARSMALQIIKEQSYIPLGDQGSERGREPDEESQRPLHPELPLESHRSTATAAPPPRYPAADSSPPSPRVATSTYTDTTTAVFYMDQDKRVDPESQAPEPVIVDRGYGEKKRQDGM